MIEININLVFTIINLIVLYLLMKKFLFGPILNVMEQRKNMIDQQFASAKDTEGRYQDRAGKCYEGYGKQSGRDRAGCSLKDHGREKQQSAGFVPL